MNRLPRDVEHDDSRTVAKARRDAVAEASGATHTHVGSFSFEPEVLAGNVEGFSGVGQVPFWFAGPLRVNGEYAVGKMRFLRFDFTTGDAAGQNMVSKATRHACAWMREQGIEGLEHFAPAK